jgi:flagellar motor switch/type III secretory pathway protein FliN
MMTRREFLANVASIPAIQHETASPAQTATPVRPGSAEDLLPWLPCTLGLELPVVNFTVGYLLKLKPGSLVRTASHQSSDLPLNVNGVLMAWTEFEVVGERLAARITDLV